MSRTIDSGSGAQRNPATDARSRSPAEPAGYYPGTWTLLTRGGPRQLDPASYSGATNAFVIGRDADLCHYASADPSLSRRHVRFFFHKSELFAEDLNSTNGTTVEGQPLQPFKPAPLENGQQLEIGTRRFYVQRA